MIRSLEPIRSKRSLPGSPSGMTRAWTIAPPLAAAGVDLDWCVRAAPPDESALEPGLEWVASTLSVATLLSEVKESTRRISELVAAVRSYTANGPRLDAAH